MDFGKFVESIFSAFLNTFLAGVIVGMIFRDDILHLIEHFLKTLDLNIIF